VNWRAIGCGVAAAATFVAIGLLGMSLAFSRFDGCPPQLQWADRTYTPVGEALSSPTFDEGEPVEIGSTFIGLTTRRVYGPPGSEPNPSAADRPTEIVLECGDGGFQPFRWDAQSWPEPPMRRWVASA
jgi:hypothetical protein